MTAFLVVAGLLAFGVFALIATVGWFLLSLIGWLLWLPLRLLFGVVALPFLLLKFVLVSIAAVVFGIIAVVALSAVAFAVLVAVIAPLLPVLLILGLGWTVIRLAGNRRYA